MTRIGTMLMLSVLMVSLALCAEEPPVVAPPEPVKPTPAEENPFRLAKVGDWVEWKTSTQLSSKDPKQPTIKSESHIKETVRTVGPKLLSIQMQIMGQTEPIFMETQYPLDRPYHPEWLGRSGPMDVLNTETEKREVAGKSLECTVKEFQSKGDDGAAQIKVWYHPDIPLGGYVRLELRAADGTITIREAQAFGREATK